jgi:hypothetical protein
MTDKHSDGLRAVAKAIAGSTLSWLRAAGGRAAVGVAGALAARTPAVAAVGRRRRVGDGSRSRANREHGGQAKGDRQPAESRREIPPSCDGLSRQSLVMATDEGV